MCFYLGFLIYFSYGIVKSIGYLNYDEKRRLSISSISSASSSSFSNEDEDEDEDHTADDIKPSNAFDN